MSKLLGATLFGASSWLLYRKVTEFETNVLVENKQVKTCLFSQVNRYIVETDKGSFNVGRDIMSWQLDDKKVYEDLTVNQLYHVTAYGLDYPKLHLYKRIVSHNGTPCDIPNHCGNRESLLSRVISKF